MDLLTKRGGGWSLTIFFGFVFFPESFLIESSLLLDTKALCQQLRVVLQGLCNKNFILEKIIITVGPLLMKLYTLLNRVLKIRIEFSSTGLVQWISGWQRVKIGFKGREREGRIELVQVEGREKAREFKQFEIVTKVHKT